jgi:2-methylcitrate dehydratase PrpD
LQLHGELNGAEIERVNVETYQAALDVCDRPLPKSEYEAKFSLYHAVAVALQNGRIQFQSFDAEHRKEVADLRQKISVAAAEPWVSAYPESWGAHVTVTTKKGNEHTAKRDGARGDPEHALDDNEMLEKARVLLEYGGCDQANSNRIIEGIMSLPSGGSDIAPFLRDQFIQ